MSDPADIPLEPPPAGPWTLDIEAPAAAEPETAAELSRSYQAALERQPATETASLMPSAEAASAAPPPLERIVEALLFVGGPPLSAIRAAEAVRGLEAEQLAQTIDTLNLGYRAQGRPYVIQKQEQGWVMVLRPRFQSVVEALHGGAKEARLSTQVVDVLALVAYRQPATKQEIDALRGADCGAPLRQLVRRGLIAVVQRGDAANKEVSYGTTPRFLELFHLRSLDDLPQTQDLQRL